MWSDRRLLDLFDIEHPIIQAPMAGPSTPELAAAVSNAGGLGSLAFAMTSLEQARLDLARIKTLTNKGFNVNFFCHTPPVRNPETEAAWRARLLTYAQELDVTPDALNASAERAPFDAAMCGLMEDARPKVVSFHFGLPEAALLARVKATGAIILASATTVAEARWLAERGVDAIIAQGYEAGGHRGIFLGTDVLGADLVTQAGTMALVPQIVDAVQVPVIAAGGIGDARGIVAALALGAAGAQLGTAYLHCPEAKVSALHRTALANASDASTALTNLFTGRPARGIVNRVMREVGPISSEAPQFPLAAGAMGPLRAAAEAKGLSDFTPLWSGQAASLGRATGCTMGAADLTRKLAADTLAQLRNRRA
jgi:nitronate monooxygenase